MKEEKKKIQNNFIVAAGLLALFILYTVAIMFVDVQPIGPQGSSVGFAEVNQYFHTLFGVNMLLYSITDWLSIPVLFIMFGFAMVGLVQLIKRKSLFRVDSSILVLGGAGYIGSHTVYELIAAGEKRWYMRKGLHPCE